MKLTKAQRHGYYKEALASDEELNYNGICDKMAVLFERDFGGFFDCGHVPPLLPEFAKFKTTDADGWWWPLDEDGLKERKKVLRACIRETMPKKRKTR